MTSGTYVMSLLIVVVICMMHIMQAAGEFNVEHFHRVKTPKRDIQLTSCYKNIVATTRIEGLRVTHLNRTDINDYLVDIKSPFVVWNLKGNLSEVKYAQQEYYMTVIVAESVFDIDLTWYYLYMSNLNMRTKCSTFKPQLRILIVYLGQDNVDKVFKFLWKKHMVNVIVILPHDTNVYTYFPYGAGECAQNIRAEVLGNCLEIHSDALYPVKGPQTYNGCKVRVGSRIRIGHVMKHYTSSEDARLVGFEEVLVNVIFKKLNLTKQPVTEDTVLNSSIKKYQYSFHTSWTDIFESRSDVAYSAVSIVDHYIYWFDISHVFFQDYVTWTVPMANTTAQWKAAILIFDVEVWYFLLGMFCINVVVWWLDSRATTTASNERAFTLSECILSSWLVLMNGAITFPRATALKFVVCAWSMFCLVVIAGYQGKLLAFLLHPIYDPQISTEQELVNSNLNIILFGVQLNDLNLTNSPFVQQIAAKAKYVHSEGYTSHLYYPEKHDALLINTFAIRYLTPRYYLDSKGATTRYTFKNISIELKYGVFFVRGHPLRDRFDEVLLRVIASGLLAKWIDDVNSVRPSVLQDEQVDVQLTMEHLSCAFYILGIGLTLAFLVLFVEIVFDNIYQKFSDWLNDTYRNFAPIV